MCAVYNQRLDHAEHLFVDTTGIQTLDSVKISFMVAVEEISTGFLTRMLVQAGVVSITVLQCCNS